MVNCRIDHHLGPSVFHWVQARFFDNVALIIARFLTPIAGWLQHCKAGSGT